MDNKNNKNYINTISYYLKKSFCLFFLICQWIVFFRIMEENNPWAIDSIFEMQYFNCPSCNFRTQSKQSFVEHAFEEHPESIEFLVKISDGSLDDIDYRWKSRWDQKVEIKPDPEDDESEGELK